MLNISAVNNKSVSRTVFRANKISVNDLRYKEALISGLKDTFSLSVSPEALESVAGPDEFKSLLKKFTQKDFAVGKYFKKITPLKDAFENILRGLYRVNLHIHTVFSDGKLTLEDFLRQSFIYANKVAKENKPDDLPPYTTAITDHNNVEGVKKAIASIASEPEKYKNLKFVAGCEFRFRDEAGSPALHSYEALGFCFNPFDKELSSSLTDFNDLSIIPKIKEYDGVFSYAHPLRYCQKNKFNEDFLKYLISKGVNGVESRYQYLDFRINDDFIKQIDEVRSLTDKYDLYETGGTDTHSENIFHKAAKFMLTDLLGV